MSKKTFELRIEPGTATDYGMALYRIPARGEDRNGDGGPWQSVVRVQGVPMRAVLDQVLATIKQAGYRPTDLARSRRFPLPSAKSRASGLDSSCWP